MAPDDRALIQRVARGDASAFGELVGRYQDRLFTVGRRLLGNRADAEDAVQRAFLNCYLKAAGYDARWQVSTWLYRVLTNVCVDELRRRRAARVSLRVFEAEGPTEKTKKDLDLRRALEKVPPAGPGEVNTSKGARIRRQTWIEWMICSRPTSAWNPLPRSSPPGS
ncbi:MAG: sigma-70 family RNA polymerase sigma factor [Candidatus Rokubacteria bacterium]|nr:sigma-70 family RNA polymerase sigma factor [Candidatus Rokubacteria bacterium]